MKRTRKTAPVATLIVLLLPGLSFGGLLGDPVQFQATTSNPNVFPFGPQTATITDPGVEFTWSPVSTVFGLTTTVQVDFHDNSLDLIFSIDSSNVTLPGPTILSFVDLNPNTSITNVTVARNFSLEVYTNNMFTTNLINPHSFNLTFTSLGFGTISSSPSSDTLTLAIQTQTAVPEPSTFTLLGLSTLGLVSYAWRRKRAA
jgi:hypothetical protein